MIKLLFFIIFIQFTKAKQCLPLKQMEFLCYQNFKSGNLKSVEFISQGQLVPNASLYLYENQRPMVYMDWNQKQFIHFKQNGDLLQRLDNDDYTYYENDEVVTHCIGSRCSSQKWDFVKVNTTNLQIGDVIFSGNLSIYAGTGKAQFTHISIFSGYKNKIPQVLGSDMSEKVQISDFDDSVYNTINYVVLRSKVFQTNVKKLLKNKSYKHQFFCSELFRNLVRESFPKAHNPLNDFASIHPETLLQNNYHFFKIIDLKLQKKENLQDFFSRRKNKLQKQVNDWHQIVSQPQEAIYQIFAKQFIFLPLVFSRKMMESMIRFSTSGLFKKANPTQNVNTQSISKNSILQKNKSTCFSTKKQNKICFYTDDKLSLLSLEVFSKSLVPDWLIYLKKQKISNYLKFQKTNNIYYEFDQSSKVSSRYANGNFLKIKNGKIKLKCKQKLCDAKDVQWQKVDSSHLKVGDVLFTGSTFAYSGNQESYISHISIVEKIQDNQVYILSNDIYKAIEILPLETLNQNLHTYFTLRSKRFTTEFKKFRKNSPLNMIELPYFCANLYISIFKKAFPKFGSSFDEIQKNHAETIFFNTYSKFKVIDYKVRNNLNLKQLIKKQKLHIINERKKLNSIMSSNKNQLYRLLSSNFSLSPFTLNQKRLKDLLKFMMFYSD
ncbi:MAG: hypothetical protein COB02_11925 [Candidatus Cloacimonadota bacterium]|nr:MAG: hypothetical protein COB02_11925 [Candidatus Cloacimonadota bacterium]